MSNDLALIISDFKNQNVENIETLYDNLHKTILHSLENATVTSLKNSLESITSNYERINNLLDLEINEHIMCFYYGCISSITNLTIDIIHDHTLSESLEQLAKNYVLLLPALTIIQEKHTVSGSDLQKSLQMKSSSNLSNFLHRIRKYDLIRVQKIGTSNYLSLTLKGERLLAENRDKKTVSEKDAYLFSLKEVCMILEGISEALKETNPSTIKTLHRFFSVKLNGRDRQVLKQKLEQIFCSRDEYFRAKLKANSNSSSILFFNNELYDFNCPECDYSDFDCSGFYSYYLDSSDEKERSFSHV